MISQSGPSLVKVIFSEGNDLKVIFSEGNDLKVIYLEDDFANAGRDRRTDRPTDIRSLI